MFKFTRAFLALGAFLCTSAYAFDSYAMLAYALLFTMLSLATLLWEWFTE